MQCVKMPVAIYVMWRNTRTLHHAQTMIQYTIPYMHTPRPDILWLRRSSKADVWTVVLQVYNKRTQLVISIWLPPPQQSFSCCRVSYFQGTLLINLKTLQHNEEAALEQLPIIHLPPHSVWLVHTDLCYCNLVTRCIAWQEASRTNWTLATIKPCSINFELWHRSIRSIDLQAAATYICMHIYTALTTTTAPPPPPLLITLPLQA